MAQSPEEIAARVHRHSDVIARALSELAEAKLIEQFPIGTGRIVMYGSSDDAHVRGLMELLRTRYHEGGEARAELVRRTLRLVNRREEDPARGV